MASGLKGNLVVASWGPTAVINASVAGVAEEAKNSTRFLGYTVASRHRGTLRGPD